MQVKYFTKIFDNVSSTTESNEIINLYSDILSIHVDGTFSSLALKIYGKATKESGEFVELAGINMNNFDIVNTIDAKGIYEVAAEGICIFKFEITSISGGNATVDIRLVSTGV